VWRAIIAGKFSRVYKGLWTHGTALARKQAAMAMPRLLKNR
jgi:hypothetical protein